ncbi:MAG: hypothetical protein B6245_14300 [Desulfobacteraceae bacterium 4572_88]|nr:MAG: hypothetical protein B6245_14300 [Desulfobacteraceae bacterium 4572_88]
MQGLKQIGNLFYKSRISDFEKDATDNGQMTVANRIRRSFGKIRKIVDIPDLIGMQRESYHRFLQLSVLPEDRAAIGLQAVFKSVFPIRDFSGSASLEFVSYRFGEVKHSVGECIHRGMTYELPVKITVRLVVYDLDRETGVSSIRDIKEQEIYFGTIPLMTDRGTFIINGTERVVVSQLHRSSGVFFNHDKGKVHSTGKVIYSSRIIPVRGSWIDMEIDPKDIVYIKIDKRRKFPITLLFKACGYSTEDILSFFYKKQRIFIEKADDFLVTAPGEGSPAGLVSAPEAPEESDEKEQITPGFERFSDFRFYEEFAEFLHKGRRATMDVTDPATGQVIVRQKQKFTLRSLRQIRAAGIKKIPIPPDEMHNRFFAHDITDSETGELIVPANSRVNPESLSRFTDAMLRNGTEAEFALLCIDEITGSDSIRKTLLLDKVETREDALMELYRRLRPGNPATPEVAQDFTDQMFFRTAYYDLSGVGRMKINLRLGIDTPIEVRTLRREDILMTTRTLIELREAQGMVDDIDHLGNRRVRAVGELLENQYRIGLVRMERAIRERMSLQEVDALMPNDLINPKPVSAVIKEFFGTSQLSQFMDQTNPLSETTHKRRLSALGPGGLTRERAGFEVRDVHPSHYGRICPIETPEGPNIGLIVSLASYARVNDFGFIETPYVVVGDGIVTDEVRSLTAFEEKDYPIAQANAPLDSSTHADLSDAGRSETDSSQSVVSPVTDDSSPPPSGQESEQESGPQGAYEFRNALVTSRVLGEFMMVPRKEIRYMDVSPNQLVSVSASLIPFLENDDANRALMGSNMQRQAVPLVVPRSPLVGTGIEGVVARDSGVTVVAPFDAVVTNAEAGRIILKKIPCAGENMCHGGDMEWVRLFNLSKFVRSNQNTCFNQHPIVRKGQMVRKGDIIADGPSTEKGELALGKNITVAFMPWEGYNFEDSILISENIVRDGVYTSVHIEEFEVVARDTKLGKEEITRDIPNVGEDALGDLDDCQGRDSAVTRGKVAPRHFRGKSRRCQGHLPAGASRSRGHCH